MYTFPEIAHKILHLNPTPPHKVVTNKQQRNEMEKMIKSLRAEKDYMSSVYTHLMASYVALFACISISARTG